MPTLSRQPTGTFTAADRRPAAPRAAAPASTAPPTQTAQHAQKHSMPSMPPRTWRRRSCVHSASHTNRTAALELGYCRGVTQAAGDAVAGGCRAGEEVRSKAEGCSRAAQRKHLRVRLAQGCFVGTVHSLELAVSARANHTTQDAPPHPDQQHLDAPGTSPLQTPLPAGPAAAAAPPTGVQLHSSSCTSLTCTCQANTKIMAQRSSSATLHTRLACHEGRTFSTVAPQGCWGPPHDAESPRHTPQTQASSQAEQATTLPASPSCPALCTAAPAAA